MRVLGLDYGAKRIGVAISDPLGMIAQPLLTLEPETAVARLKELITEYGQVDEIVVGLPKRLSGELGPAAEKVLAFVEELRQALPVKISTYDERLTTAAAEKTLLSAGLSRAKRKQVIDRSAAANILQNYLDRKQK